MPNKLYVYIFHACNCNCDSVQHTNVLNNNRAYEQLKIGWAKSTTIGIHPIYNKMYIQYVIKLKCKYLVTAFVCGEFMGIQFT